MSKRIDTEPDDQFRYPTQSALPLKINAPSVPAGGLVALLANADALPVRVTCTANDVPEAKSINVPGAIPNVLVVMCVTDWPSFHAKSL